MLNLCFIWAFWINITLHIFQTFPVNSFVFKLSGVLVSKIKPFSILSGLFFSEIYRTWNRSILNETVSAKIVQVFGKFAFLCKLINTLRWSFCCPVFITKCLWKYRFRNEWRLNRPLLCIMETFYKPKCEKNISMCPEIMLKLWDSFPIWICIGAKSVSRTRNIEA